MPKQTVYEKIARQTSDRVGKSWTLNVRLGEETFTDLLALDLALSTPGGIKVFQTTKAEEARRGTDLEIFVRRPQGAIILAIQAKKLDAKLNYASLKQSVRGRKVLQLDQLENWAAKRGAIPLYLLFNSVTPKEASNSWHCCQSQAPKQLGCTFVPSWRVRAAITTRGCRNFSFLHKTPTALPWRCPFTCRHGKGRWTAWLKTLRSERHEVISQGGNQLKATKAQLSRYEKLSLEPEQGKWPGWLWQKDSGLLSKDERTQLFQGVEAPKESWPRAVILVDGD